MAKNNPRREMPNTMSVTQLSQNASGAVDRAIELGETTEPLVILRHNKPVAVLLEHEAYQRLLAAYIELETEDSIRMFEREHGIKREDLPAYLGRLEADETQWISLDELAKKHGVPAGPSDETA